MHPSPPPARKASAALEAFLSHFSLRFPPFEAESPTSREALEDVVRAFSRLPYENLTKIIKRDSVGNPRLAKRLPHEVVREHASRGTGGTCFSLTFTLLDLLRSLGWMAEPILADRRYGENTHCALVVWLDGLPHLVDPGFLIIQPIRLESGKESRLETGFNTVRLLPRREGEKVDLYTEQQDASIYRLTFKMTPVDEATFVRAWEASFDWDMMRYPLLTRLSGDRQLYLQGRKLQHRDRGGVSRREVAPDDLTESIAREFGVDARIVARALGVLERQGESVRHARFP